MTWAVDAHTRARSMFGVTGALQSVEFSTGEKGINISQYVRHSLSLFAFLTLGTLGRDFMVFAISVDMGAIDGTTSKPVTWGISLLRETPIAYTTLSGTVQRRDAYWTSQYKIPQDAVQCTNPVSF